MTHLGRQICHDRGPPLGIIHRADRLHGFVQQQIIIFLSGGELPVIDRDAITGQYTPGRIFLQSAVDPYLTRKNKLVGLAP